MEGLIVCSRQYKQSSCPGEMMVEYDGDETEVPTEANWFEDGRVFFAHRTDHSQVWQSHLHAARWGYVLYFDLFSCCALCVSVDVWRWSFAVVWFSCASFQSVRLTHFCLLLFETKNPKKAKAKASRLSESETEGERERESHSHNPKQVQFEFNPST